MREVREGAEQAAIDWLDHLISKRGQGEWSYPTFSPLVTEAPQEQVPMKGPHIPYSGVHPGGTVLSGILNPMGLQCLPIGWHHG